MQHSYQYIVDMETIDTCHCTGVYWTCMYWTRIYWTCLYWIFVYWMWIWGGINTHAFAEVDSQGKAWMLHVQTQLGAVCDTLLSWVSQALLAGHWVCVALRLQMQVFYV